MQVEMPSNVRIRKAGAKKQRRCVNRSTGGDDRAAAHIQNGAVDGRMRPGAAGFAICDFDAVRSDLNIDARAGSLGIGEPGLRRGLFGAERTAVTAIAADPALL